MSSKTSLLIMAAGLGSRYGGDKQVDRIGPDGEILMQYSVYDALKSGFNKIVLVIKPAYREILEEIFAPLRSSGIEVCFAYQDFSSIPDCYTIPKERIKPFGTVHALLSAKDVICEPFAVINADDFYGADSFKVMYSALTALFDRTAAMVAYDLSNTVSPNGTVTRGICKVDNGKLIDIKETYDIALCPSGEIKSGECVLDGSLPISMNMWGFSPDIFIALDTSFKNFLSRIPQDDIKAEYVIATFIDEQIKSGALDVNVLRTSSRWFGVTYREDRDAVADRLAKMKQSGEYPEKLKI